MIFEGSRYGNSTVEMVQTSEGWSAPAIFPTNPYGANFPFEEHVVGAGDRIDLIAARFLGDPELWWMIAVANPEVTVYEPLEVGLELRIPRVRIR